MQTRPLFTLTPILAALLISCGSDSKPDVAEANGVRVDTRPNVIVVFTDDQGYADLGANGITSDIQTPHLDQLASDGVRMTSGYVTAPQCVPSRAALLTGKYQQSFGLNDNRDAPLSVEQETIADRFRDAGYRTGIAGKWHLDVNAGSYDFDLQTITDEEKAVFFPENKGFDDVYFGYAQRWWTNFSINGDEVEAGYRMNRNYRMDVATDASITFIEKHQHEPFFLYLPYFAPHVPLEAPDEYLLRHDSATEVRRQYALAMMSAVDDGVGKIRQKLEELQLDDDTVIIYLSDNGAPLGRHMVDAPIDQPAEWNGSLNSPWIGEKGMLSEGGIRVPFIVTWPGVIPNDMVFDDPVSALDVASTGLTLAEADTAGLDGENLIPFLTGEQSGLYERPLYWRFKNQAAIRQGEWKYLMAGDREYLFDLSANQEHHNLMSDRPDKADELKQQLAAWANGLSPAGLPESLPLTAPESDWYDFYLTN